MFGTGAIDNAHDYNSVNESVVELHESIYHMITTKQNSRFAKE